MPYSLPTPSAGRPTHRRSYTHSSGAFASLGSLPRIAHHRPVFHIQNDCSSDDDEHGLLSSPPAGTKPLRLDTHLAVPFHEARPRREALAQRFPAGLLPHRGPTQPQSCSPMPPSQIFTQGIITFVFGPRYAFIVCPTYPCSLGPIYACTFFSRISLP